MRALTKKVATSRNPRAMGRKPRIMMWVMWMVQTAPITSTTWWVSSTSLERAMTLIIKTASIACSPRGYTDCSRRPPRSDRRARRSRRIWEAPRKAGISKRMMRMMMIIPRKVRRRLSPSTRYYSLKSSKIASSKICSRISTMKRKRRSLIFRLTTTQRMNHLMNLLLAVPLKWFVESLSERRA